MERIELYWRIIIVLEANGVIEKGQIGEIKPADLSLKNVWFMQQAFQVLKIYADSHMGELQVVRRKKEFSILVQLPI